MRPTRLAVFSALLICTSYLHATSVAADPYVTASAALMMDAETGGILYEKNPHVPLPMASTTKIMTALLGVERLHPRDTVRVSSYAISMMPSKIYLKSGEMISVSELLSAILLSSANDASVALAEKISGSESAFARAMTARAGALGARDTRFENASGLPAEGHYSTAYDLAILLKYAMQVPAFAEIMQWKTRTIGSPTGQQRLLRNHNRLLWTFPGALGGKTGFTRAAKHCYVGMVERGGHPLIVSVLGSSDLWRDTRQLLEYGFDRLNGGETQLVMSASPKLLAASAQARPLRPVRKPAVAAGGSAAAYTVQLGAFQDKRHAEALRRTLRNLGYQAYITSTSSRGGRWHRVRVGEFETRRQASGVVGQLQSRTRLRAQIAAAD
jgi:D-alanyl-D-alanine carboxypeptidase (penicillin-binding protein 5/6)